MGKGAKDRFDYLVIGNSAGGIGCVEGIRKVDPQGTIAVLSDERHHPYGRPLITHLLDGEVTPERMAYRPLDFYTQARVTPLLGSRAEALDLANGRVKVGKGSVSYGKLLLATGGKPILPPMPGSELGGVRTMITLDDALAVKERLGTVRRAVVLGGGLIGTKTAEALAKVVEKVTIVELADRLLGLVSDDVSSALIREAFTRNGVEVITGTTIAEIRGAGGNVTEVLLRDGTLLPADLVILAIGVTPRVELAAGTGISLERGFLVDQRMATTAPGVWACGDAATAWDFVLGGMRLLPLWPNAYVGGRVAGLNMAGEATDYRWATNMNAAVFFGLPVVSAGLLQAPPGREGFTEVTRQGEGSYSKLVMEGDRVRGMIMAGKVDRAGIYLGFMRDQLATGDFAGKLLDDRFSAAYLPASLRERFRQSVRAIG